MGLMCKCGGRLCDGCGRCFEDMYDEQDDHFYPRKPGGKHYMEEDEDEEV